MSDRTSPPQVTVVLPTYNRAAFLPAAFDSIRNQTLSDWSVVVVDDGSTDDTRATVQQFANVLGDRIHYVYQANRGAYAARNRGLDDARGTYVAFFDSDDLWLPHHLERCVTALQSNPDVDWVFGACRQVDHATGRTIDPNTFLIDGRPRPFVNLKSRQSGGLRIIIDPDVLACQILHGLYCGLQNSVMKRSLFDRDRFNPESKVIDDQFFVTRALVAGARFGYFMEPHVIYRVHDDNSSGSATVQSLQKQIAIFTESIAGLEQLVPQLAPNRRARRALSKRLGQEYFWQLGYAGYWQAGRRREALEMFKRGLAEWPWSPAPWKTYWLARLKVRLDRATSSP
jgi:Glycosyltransferases involved in cell wall biogenesis